MILEIEERKQFLDQMTVLGKKREYQQIISNEIADVSMIKQLITVCFVFSLFLENT